MFEAFSASGHDALKLPAQGRRESAFLPTKIADNRIISTHPEPWQAVEQATMFREKIGHAGGQHRRETGGASELEFALVDRVLSTEGISEVPHLAL